MFYLLSSCANNPHFGARALLVTKHDPSMGGKRARIRTSPGSEKRKGKTLPWPRGRAMSI
jgi:hypothetical protein